MTVLRHGARRHGARSHHTTAALSLLAAIATLAASPAEARQSADPTSSGRGVSTEGEAPSEPTCAAPRVFAAVEAADGSGSVRAVDAAAGTSSRLGAVGLFPNGLALSSDESVLYVPNMGDGSVSIVDVRTGRSATVTGPSIANVTSLAASPVAPALVAVGNSGVGPLVTVDVRPVPATQRLVESSPGTPASFNTVGGHAFSSDGTTLFVPDYIGDRLVSVDVASRQVTNSLSFASLARPFMAVPTRDGTKVYVSLLVGDRVAVVNPTTMTVLGNVQRPGGGGDAVVDTASRMVLSRDGSRLYVVSRTPDAVTVVDTTTDSVVGKVTGVTKPRYVAVSPDGSELYVDQSTFDPSTGNAASGSVRVFATSDYTEVRSIDMGGAVMGMAVACGAAGSGGNWFDVTPPVVTASTEVTVDAGATDVTELSADETVTWSFAGGADDALFRLDGGRLLFADPAVAGTYAVQVSAADARGNSTTVSITVTVIAADTIPPSAPVHRQTVRGDGSATLTLRVASVDGLTGAQARCRHEGVTERSEVQPVDGRRITVTVDGLSNRETWRCAGRVRDDGGWSPWSSVRKITPSTAPARRPVAPEIDTVEVDTRDVTLTVSSLRDRGATITRYAVRCVRAGQHPARSSSSSPTITVVELAKPNQWECQARVKNAVAWSDWSPLRPVVA